MARIRKMRDARLSLRYKKEEVNTGDSEEGEKGMKEKLVKLPIREEGEKQEVPESILKQIPPLVDLDTFRAKRENRRFSRG